VAAQQLMDQGFKKVINLSGGIKAWDGFEAIGREDQGLQLFENLDSAEQILTTAYSLEEGLQDFYLRMMQEVTSAEVIKLFRKLADIEDIHKEKIFDEYSRVTGSSDRLSFEKSLEKDALEGGMTTDEYLERFTPDFEKPAEVISLAMTIEAQALDLYTRAGRNSKDPDNQEMLERIAKEEKYHLEQLGSLLDNILEAQ
jgi:sulfur-carrier protein adenylyltransferase/sulfurtransferase